MLQVVQRVIARHLLGQAGLKADEADSGAVTLIQRFGSAANLNIHMHCLVLEPAVKRCKRQRYKRLDDPEPSPFIRPGAQGCGDRLRQRFAGRANTTRGQGAPVGDSHDTRVWPALSTLCRSQPAAVPGWSWATRKGV